MAVNTIADELAITIQIHFGGVFSKSEVIAALTENKCDVLDTMRSLHEALDSRKEEASPEVAEDLLVAVQMHFSGIFSLKEIRECLTEQKGDVLACLRVLKTKHDGAPHRRAKL